MKNRKIIVIAGKQYSGKDTLAELLQEQLPGFEIAPIARGLKEEFAKIKHITTHELEMNKPIYRAELITLSNKHRDKDPDCWLKRVLSKEGNLIVSDLRLKHELETFKKQTI